MSASLALLSLPLLAVAGPGLDLVERPRMAVLSLEFDEGVSGDLADRLSRTFASAMLSQTSFRAVAGDELHSILNPVGPPQRLACSVDDARACAKEIAHSSSTSFVAFGQIGLDRAGAAEVVFALFDVARDEVVATQPFSSLSDQAVRGGASVLLERAEIASQMRAPPWATSTLTGVGLAGVLAGVATTLGGGAIAAISAWAFFHPHVELHLRQAARWTNVLGYGVAAVGVLIAAGGAATVGGAYLLVE